MVLKALVNCAQQCLEQATEEKRKRSSSLRVPGLLPLIRTKLSNSAGRVLTYNSDAQEPWKSKGDLLQQLLHMLVQFNSSPIDLLEEIACTVLPQVTPSAVIMISPSAQVSH
jgi:Fanconi anemia group D2 protein